MIDIKPVLKHNGLQNNRARPDIEGWKQEIGVELINLVMGPYSKSIHNKIYNDHKNTKMDDIYGREYSL